MRLSKKQKPPSQEHKGKKSSISLFMLILRLFADPRLIDRSGGIGLVGEGVGIDGRGVRVRGRRRVREGVLRRGLRIRREGLGSMLGDDGVWTEDVCGGFEEGDVKILLWKDSHGLLSSWE